jgi:hypothetical protein
MAPASGRVRVAVVTGGHSFDVPSFTELFWGLEGVDAYIQSTDDFASAPKETRQAYDAVLFYSMLLETPRDQGLPWYAGKPLTALSELGETPQGIVLLHHAVLAYRQWPLWDEIVGIQGRGFGYAPEQRVRSEIANADHPITAGLSPWEMVDETYSTHDAGEGSEVLITYDHPRSMRTIAWTRQYRQARVFCYQAGHDASAYRDDSFREVLRRGILWSAGRL